MLMTTAHGFLNAALSHQPQPEIAITELNRFLAPRLADDKFLTLWVAVIDLPNRILHYVDAGHGYAYLATEDSTAAARLDQGDNFPIGVSPDFVYQPVSIPLESKGYLVVVSDGVIEQPAGGGNDDSCVRRFGETNLSPLMPQLRSAPRPTITLIDHPIAYAGATELADNASAVVVRW
jgi:serine phosphatase RsbU (regulator of sigma subunit)